jgi:hypothetical protein
VIGPVFQGATTSLDDIIKAWNEGVPPMNYQFQLPSFLVGSNFLPLFILKDYSKGIVKMIFKPFVVSCFFLYLRHCVPVADEAFESYIKAKGSKQGQKSKARDDTQLIERGAPLDGTHYPLGYSLSALASEIQKPDQFVICFKLLDRNN